MVRLEIKLVFMSIRDDNTFDGESNPNLPEPIIVLFDSFLELGLSFFLYYLFLHIYNFNNNNESDYISDL